VEQAAQALQPLFARNSNNADTLQTLPVTVQAAWPRTSLGCRPMVVAAIDATEVSRLHRARHDVCEFPPSGAVKDLTHLHFL
jgi:hypothetical protein